MSPADTKNWARQIVKSSFDEILVGKFQIPSQEEVETYIREELHVPFDEYRVKKRIRDFHPGWTEIEISDEFERQKMKHYQEGRKNLTWFAQNTIAEIEKLIRSLDQTITEWKVLNL